MLGSAPVCAALVSTLIAGAKVRVGVVAGVAGPDAPAMAATTTAASPMSGFLRTMQLPPLGRPATGECVTVSNGISADMRVEPAATGDPPADADDDQRGQRQQDRVRRLRHDRAAARV